MSDRDLVIVALWIAAFGCVLPPFQRVGSVEQRALERFVRKDGRNLVRGADGDFYRCVGARSPR